MTSQHSIPPAPSARPDHHKDLFHQKDISPRREIRLSQLGLLITLAATILLFWQVTISIASEFSAHSPAHAAEQILFALIALGMIYGNVVYQLTRIGYMRRLLSHHPASPIDLDPIFLLDTPTLTILVPSYKEDPDVVRRTLLSAALQQYPHKRVVLLIDDPSNPSHDKDRALLNAAEDLPREIELLLLKPAAEFASLLRAFNDRRTESPLNFFGECLALAEAHTRAAQWFEQQADLLAGPTHSDDLFIRQTFLEPAAEHKAAANRLQSLATNAGPYPTETSLLTAYQRLAARFRTSLSSFQRKKFLNLSHEANKAMNLNSYIGLLGKRFSEKSTEAGLLLEPAPSDQPAILEIPHADYLITLDADSILAPDYALRLVHFAQQPENARVAVVQTPYSAEPNPPGLVERIAGATTDIQYLIHQGFTHYNATFWVGANALLRTSALHDITATETERGYTVHRFIQDRTVIEDTESSVDLTSKGWKLHNYPERLSHSATPADFGSLLIQRRRWANGGLIILPKLLRYIFLGNLRQLPSRSREGFFRLHYLVSIATVNIALPLMLMFPFEKNLRNIWFPLTCIPYFFLYGRDLVQAGYSVADLFRVYALNILMIPVNLGGVFKSIQQAWTKEKIPFKRTPKVSGRTMAPAGYILAALAIALYCVVGIVLDGFAQRWFHAAFALLNGLFLVYAILAFIGFKNARQDLAPAFPTFRKWYGQLSALPDKIRPPDIRLPSVHADE